MSTRCYAVKNREGVILAKTVGTTPRKAMAGWLATEKRVFKLDHLSEDTMAVLFRQMAEPEGARVVNITLVEDV